MRREYEMSEEQFAALLDASAPVVCIKIGNSWPRTPQENANAAWAQLGKQMGFLSLTVKPIPGYKRRFTAEAIEPVEAETNVATADNVSTLPERKTK